MGRQVISRVVLQLQIHRWKCRNLSSLFQHVHSPDDRMCTSEGVPELVWCASVACYLDISAESRGLPIAAGESEEDLVSVPPSSPVTCMRLRSGRNFGRC